MRIISGSFRGKKILKPNDIKTRPLKDLTKESIFNIIEHSNKFEMQVNNSNVLDIFSGVGSFGIECLSRGAKKVIFVENYSRVLSILKKNLLSLKLLNNFKIIEKDVYGNGLANLNIKFDIIFLDPPFKDKNFNLLLKKINELSLLIKNGIIILHKHKNDEVSTPENFKIIEEKVYGISKIFFLTNLD